MSSLQKPVTNQFALVFTITSFFFFNYLYTQSHTHTLQSCIMYSIIYIDIQSLVQVLTLLHTEIVFSVNKTLVCTQSFLTMHIIYRRYKSVISNLQHFATINTFFLLIFCAYSLLWPLFTITFRNILCPGARSAKGS